MRLITFFFSILAAPLLSAAETKPNILVILPEVLKPAGYANLMTGEWHLDKEPTDIGFDR